MELKIKTLTKKGNKYTVENIESEELVQRLVGRRKEINVEWLFSSESPLVKPLASKHWVQWVHGATDFDVGVVHIFLDNILKAHGLLGDVNNGITEWLIGEFTRNLVHELIHVLNPEWKEWQVENATHRLMVAIESLRLPETTDVVVQNSGKKTTTNSTLLLTEENHVLKVKEK